MHVKSLDTTNESVNQFYPVVNKFLVNTGITVIDPQQQNWA